MGVYTQEFESVWGCCVLLDVSLYLFWSSISLASSACDAVLKACLLSQQDSPQMKKMTACEAKSELPQRRLGVKEQKNGELTGNNNVQLSTGSNPCLRHQDSMQHFSVCLFQTRCNVHEHLGQGILFTIQNFTPYYLSLIQLIQRRKYTCFRF